MFKRKSKHILCSKTFSENYAVFETIWKNMVQPDRPKVTTQYSLWALRAGKLGHEYRHTIRIFNTSCCSTTTIVTRTRVILRCTYTYVARFVKIRITISLTPKFPSGLLHPGLPVPNSNISHLSNSNSIA